MDSNHHIHLARMNTRLASLTVSFSSTVIKRTYNIKILKYYPLYFFYDFLQQYEDQLNLFHSFFLKSKYSLVKNSYFLYIDYHISKYPQQIDARYVRALIQSKAPKILNYYQNIQADISFIKKNIQESDVDEKSKSTMLYQIGLIK